MLRMRYRSRTICLSLAFFTVFFHLLLVLVSLPINQQSCDPPLNPRTNILRELANKDQSSVGSDGPAEASTGRQASSKDARKDARKDASKDARGGFVPMDVSSVTERSLESDQRKMEALFDHPLYNMPGPPVPEEDGC
ncbi:putative pre-16S rRNA nuclease [Dissostichus eleginoides]|uniref:Pre-16S rRNA nuclease n=1 Tax=Dissostichus eleginoides TaxID=100907 RepID=A0AAD9EYH8_DISEL|nr:putative pre-16S rRNA nuclease [Dissostichus eleginoides]